VNKYLREEIICLETCGDIELGRSKYSTAQMYYDRAIQITNSIDNSSDLVGGLLMRMARLQTAQANYVEGLEIGKKGLSILERFGIRFELGVLYRIISESYLGLQNFQAAYKYSLKSIAILLNHEAMCELAASYHTAAMICFEWYKYYQTSSPIDEALATLVIESYNMIAFDDRTLYEAAWNNALEAHSIYSTYGNKRNLTDVETLFDNIKNLRRVNTQAESNNIRGISYYNNSAFVSYSKCMKSLLSIIEISASTAEPVLITGETGTGKELVARIIHERSERGGAPFVPVNCAAIPEHLFEREFFGNVKGAYTGADTSVAGLSDQADGGTLFLDEIGEMPLMLQAKLLRLLQDGSYHRLGDPALRRVNIRILAATNADINSLVVEHKFRPDCYYRLKTIEIQIPPLRERREDIEPLTSLFISKMLGDHYSPRDIFDDELCSIYYKYPWPGNVRELESITKRLALFAKHNQRASVDMLPKHMQQYAAKRTVVGGILKLDAYLESAEKERIMQALISSGGSRTIAADNLGISRKALYAKMRRLQLNFPL
jgi:transcriptional regulator with PAS, ATPase and Fis domain